MLAIDRGVHDRHPALTDFTLDAVRRVQRCANLVEGDGGHWAVRGWHERVSVPDKGSPTIRRNANTLTFMSSALSPSNGRSSGRVAFGSQRVAPVRYGTVQRGDRDRWRILPA
jgi:hypothetical protein